MKEINRYFIIEKNEAEGEKSLLGDFFISLAVSTMLGDAFFHILPEMLGLGQERFKMIIKQKQLIK